ncbi:MAG: PDZ domain-containing protein [Planctomycetes bacterium]|nr:PDZ domain-containing protein [Planctomycetota bacterium]
MRGPRLSAFNVIQFAITILAILFGLYGFFRTSPAANRVHDDVATCAPTPRQNKPTAPSDAPISAPRATTRPAEPLVIDAPADSLVAGNGRIIGRVKYTSGEAAGGVRVSLMGQNAAAMPPKPDFSDMEKYRREYDAYLREFSRYLMGTQTDGAGRFELTKIAESLKFNVTVGDPGVNEQMQEATAGADLVFTLKQPVVVEGIISREDGLALEAHSITLSLDHGGWSQPVRTVRFAAGSNGEFRLETSSGKYVLSVEHKGLFQKEVCKVDMTRGNALTEIVLAKACVLSGVVSGADGSGLPGVTVYVDMPGRDLNPRRGKEEEAPTYGARRRAFSDDDAERQAKIDAEHKAKLRELEDAARLKADAARVDEQRKRDIVRESDVHFLQEYHPVSVITDASGRYRIENLPPGACVAHAQVGSLAAKNELTLVSGDNTCNFTLDTGCRVKVSARDTRGNALDVAGLGLVNEKGQWVQATMLPVVTRGEADFIGVPAGKYAATVTIASKASVQRDLDVTGGVCRLDLILEEPGALKGRVNTASGKMPMEIYARLIFTGTKTTDPNADKERAKFNQHMEYHVNGDKDGNYKLENLQPGAYDFVVSLMSDYDDVLFKQSLTIASGEQTWDVVLDERSSLVVTVVLDAGLERESAYIMLAGKDNGKDDRSVNRVGNPNEKNQCEFFFLEEGEYYLSAHCEGAAQTYIPITIRRGANTASINIGPSNCVMVTNVAEGGQADGAGIKAGDLITAYNGTAITTLEQLAAAVRATEGQEGISVTFVRNGGTMSATIKGGRLGINGQDFHR